MPSLVTKEYRTISRIAGPLLFIDRTEEIAFSEIVEITGPRGEVRLAQVLEVDRRLGVIQVFAGTSGLDLVHTRARFTGDVARLDVSLSMLGRVLDGFGRPIDGGPPIIPEASLDINGLPINPAHRAQPREFIQTGVSAVDGLNTLARGQKLPIFSGAGLPANELAAQIASQARVMGGNGHEPFAVVFAAIGITHREASFFMDQFRAGGAMDRTVLFVNRADDPAIERLFTPRAALTAAEYLAFVHGRHVLVIMTDMTNYCEALREVSAAREEVPGRRGYPGYMYSDLASLYERAGRLRGERGSVTQLIILTVPDDDITHPIPDLTGYITEGQIVLGRDLHRKGVFPPIDVLPSLSRLMNAAIGAGKTRDDHRVVADQLYAFYAEARDLRRLAAIIGEAALSAEDRRTLAFANRFETEFVGQGAANRPIEETLSLAWAILADMPAERLKRIPQATIEKYHRGES
ncbi:MAG: V-type ATP synthase subunit B [Ardenticatenaceae bacterium]|nr:V-type ATP synthase subunit B [Ardenticatenaceae bacterium]MCB9445094.1 V-type ATP synthase subunit B [Ardenticatenaceae bacterium]